MFNTDAVELLNDVRLRLRRQIPRWQRDTSCEGLYKAVDIVSEMVEEYRQPPNQFVKTNGDR